MRTLKLLGPGLGLGLGLLAAGTLLGCTKNAEVAESTTGTQTELARSEVPADASPDISETDYAAFVASANEFGLDLAQQMAAQGELDPTKNSVFSPVSALMALAMTYGGAEGDAAAAMKLALHDTLAAGQYHVAQNRLKRTLAGYAHEGTDSQGQVLRVEVAPANSLWAERSVGIKSSFLDLMSREYDAGVYLADFVNHAEAARIDINGWVEGKTHDKIQELLQPGDVDSSTVFVLVNALYFYANWETLFVKTSTASAPFTTLSGSAVTANIMHDTSSRLYASGANFEAVQVGYTGGKLHLTLVLPKAGQFETVRSQVSSDWLAQVTSDMAQTTVALGLPKFQIATPQLELKPALEELGLFDGGSTISGISETPVAVDRVVQKAFIGTDEAGTEAAAATAVLLLGGMPTAPIPVTLDRPFLYFIQDETGLVLFSGQVVDPTQS